MCHNQRMKTASTRDLHIRTSELVREAADGAVILIERRGQPVAELHPISKRRPKPPLPAMSGSLAAFSCRDHR
jgi:prevent-host-death family protein